MKIILAVMHLSALRLRLLPVSGGNFGGRVFQNCRVIGTCNLYSLGIGLSNDIVFSFAHKMQRLGLLCGYYQETQMQMISV